jgi:DNA-binding transcriptional MerR regulator
MIEQSALNESRYTTGEMAYITGVPQRRIIEWMTTDYVTPDVQDTDGGRRRGYYSIENLFEVVLHDVLFRKGYAAQQRTDIVLSCQAMLFHLIEKNLNKRLWTSPADTLSNNEARALTQEPPSSIDRIQDPIERQLKKHVRARLMRLPADQRKKATYADWFAGAYTDRAFLHALILYLKSHKLIGDVFLPPIGAFHVEEGQSYALLLGDDDKAYLRHTPPAHAQNSNNEFLSEEITILTMEGDKPIEAEGNFLPDFDAFECLVEIHLQHLAIRLSTSLAEFHSKPQRGAVSSPRTYSAHELRKVGVEILDEDNHRLRCVTCHTIWDFTMTPGGRLPKGYWHCPEGCNHPKKNNPSK